VPWVKLDDQFYMNPKVLAVGPQGVALHLAGMCWTAGQLTDGHIPTHILPTLAGMAGVPQRIHNRLTDEGLWDVVTGGWQIHDWLEWNPSAEKVKAERAAARDRMARHRGSPDVRANNSRTFGRSSASPSPSPVVPTEQPRRPLRSVEPQGPPAGHPTYKTFDPDAPSCMPCDGTGRNTDTGARCAYCGGTGQPQEASA
jgi:hypothetical protein